MLCTPKTQSGTQFESIEETAFMGVQQIIVWVHRFSYQTLFEWETPLFQDIIVFF